MIRRLRGHMDAQSRGKMCCPWNSASVLVALSRGRGGAGRTAVSVAKRGNESSATGPPALPPPPCLWTCFPSYLLPSLAFL